MVNINILAGYILVRPFEVEEKKTASGIIIPQTRREDVLRGEVIATGHSLPNEEMEVSVGDLVMFSKHAGRDVIVDDENYKLMQQREIHYFVKK